MNIDRRGFIGSLVGGAVFAAAPGCCSLCKSARMGKVALQLYSIRDYIKKVGFQKAIEDVAKIGYEAVEFAGYYGFKPGELKRMLSDNGLVACGTHISRWDMDENHFAKTCEFNLGFGNTTLICPGGGNFPRKEDKAPFDDFMKKLVDDYNKAAENCARYGCKVGLHNHMQEFRMKLSDGTTYWDYFFSNTSKDVLMQQDVGWTTCAGFDPCEQYKKYPHRSRSLHAKENGMGRNVKKFDAILGKPGEPGAKGVEWDRLFPVTDADGVEWYVVECERHCDSLDSVKASFDFLRSKGRV